MGDEFISVSAAHRDGHSSKFQTINLNREGMIEHLNFPLIFESSIFKTNPVIADVNGDGILDAILTDYHGGLFAISLEIRQSSDKHGTNHKYFFKAQVPRLYVRRQWMESMINETLGMDPFEEETINKGEKMITATAENNVEPKEENDQDRFRVNDERPHDPYHTYFEYSYGSGSSNNEPILRGITSSMLGQDQEHVRGLDYRRNRNYNHPKEETSINVSLDVQQNVERRNLDSMKDELKSQNIIYDSVEEDEKVRKIIYDSIEEDEKKETVIYDSIETGLETNHRRLDQVEGEVGDDPGAVDDLMEWGNFVDDLKREDDDDDDDFQSNKKERVPNNYKIKTDANLDRNKEFEGIYVDGDADSFVGPGDDLYPRFDDESSHHDDYSRYNYGDYYTGRYNEMHEEYFDDKHYIRLPPHILCTPVIVDLPTPYSNNYEETENLLFLAISYYFDEDEYEGFFPYRRFEHRDYGDETESQRGMYIANAIMIFHFGDNPRWGECIFASVLSQKLYIYVILMIR